MNKLIKSLLVVAGVTVAGFASAQTTPAEQAGLCATNAYFIKKYADAQGPQFAKLGQLATEQMGKNYSRYGQDPGYKNAVAWAVKQNTPMNQRINMADGCAKEGF